MSLFRRICSLFPPNRSQFVSARQLTFEPLDGRKLLAADLVCMPTADIAGDDAMIGRETATEFNAVSARVMDTINVRTRVLRGGLDSPDSTAAAYGYGGTPELADVVVTYGNNAFTVSGTMLDNDVTGATVTFGGAVVAANADTDGAFSIEFDGEFQTHVDVTVTDKDGNSDTQEAVTVD